MRNRLEAKSLYNYQWEDKNEKDKIKQDLNEPYSLLHGDFINELARIPFAIKNGEQGVLKNFFERYADKQFEAVQLDDCKDDIEKLNAEIIKINQNLSQMPDKKDYRKDLWDSWSENLKMELKELFVIMYADKAERELKSFWSICEMYLSRISNEQ